MKNFLKVLIILAFGLAAFAGVLRVREGVTAGQLVERVRQAMPGHEAAAAPSGPRALVEGLPNGSVRTCNTPAGFAGQRVLMVGNSLTYSGELPSILIRLADAAGRTVMVCTHAPGGQRLRQHAQDPRLMGKLLQGDWDVVVLQEQSEIPSNPLDDLDHRTVPYAIMLRDRAIRYSPRARVLLYQTPAHKNGRAGFPGLESYGSMQTAINEGYAHIARALGVEVVPAGVAWRVALAGNPGLSLYSDDRHPNPTGAYLIALTMAGALFDLDPIRAPDLGIPPAVADQLRRAAAAALDRH